MPDLTSPEAPGFRISWHCPIQDLDNWLAPTCADHAQLQADYRSALRLH